MNQIGILVCTKIYLNQVGNSKNSIKNFMRMNSSPTKQKWLRNL